MITWGGGENWSLTAASGLSDRGHEVRIVCRPESVLRQRALQAGVDVFPVQLRGDLNPAQEILLDRIMEKLMFLSLIGNYAKQHGTGIVKDGKIIPCLGENYIAYDNALQRNIKALYELEARNVETTHDADQDA